MGSSLSSVSICNSALLKIGGDVISSLTDGSRAATICNALYATLRDEVQGSAPWRFCTQQAVLAALSTPPLFKYSYSFQLPSDCLRALFLNTDPWTQQQNLIFANQPTVNLTYLQQNTDETTWDARFAEALAWRIAMELSLALVQSQGSRETSEKSYMAAIAQARAMNAVVGTSQQLIADIWSGSRRGYNGYLAPVASTPTEYYD
jgi:hypothetical protein